MLLYLFGRASYSFLKTIRIRQICFHCFHSLTLCKAWFVWNSENLNLTLICLVSTIWFRISIFSSFLLLSYNSFKANLTNLRNLSKKLLFQPLSLFCVFFFSMLLNCVWPKILSFSVTLVSLHKPLSNCTLICTKNMLKGSWIPAFS